MNISVILTSYNHESYLRESIDSIINQTYKDFELIIVDDCSQDASWEIICEYQQKFPEIKAIRHDHNWGSGAVADAVQNIAGGDYIAIHHSDDVWIEDKLEKQVEVLESHPDCVAVFTSAQTIDENGIGYENTDGFYFDRFNVENRSRLEWLNYFFYHGNCLCHPSILIRKDVYMEDGFFRNGLRQIPDFVKWIQVCKKYEIYVLPDKLVKFRIRREGRNTSGLRANTQIRSTVELFLMLQEYLDIQDKDEFLQIFPDAKQYCNKDYFSTEYVLGRICTEEGMPTYTRLFGVQLLYRVLNNPIAEKRIAEEYQYTKKIFMDENGKHDIFGIIPKGFEQTRSLYFDSGEGFSIEEMQNEKYALSVSDDFVMHCEYEVKDNKTIKALRFDPSEGIMVKCRVEKVLINGNPAKCSSDNSFYQKDEYDYFIDLDPIYSIEIPQKCERDRVLDITISGKVERLQEEMVSQYVMGVFYTKRDQIYEYEAQKVELREEIRSRDALINEINVSINDQSRMLAEQDTLITTQTAKIDEQDALIMTQTTKIDEQNAIINELQMNLTNTMQELTETKSTRWYRFGQLFRRRKDEKM